MIVGAKRPPDLDAAFKESRFSDYEYDWQQYAEDADEQFFDGSERAVVRWRYDWGEGHVRGVDIIRVQDGRLAESLAYVKG
jgi:hypothetical protein